MLQVVALDLQGRDAVAAHLVILHLVGNELLHFLVVLPIAGKVGNGDQDNVVCCSIEQGAEIEHERRIRRRGEHMPAIFQHYLKKQENGDRSPDNAGSLIERRIAVNQPLIEQRSGCAHGDIHQIRHKGAGNTVT